MITKAQLAEEIARQDLDNVMWPLVEKLDRLQSRRMATLANWFGNKSGVDWVYSINRSTH